MEQHRYDASRIWLGRPRTVRAHDGRRVVLRAGRPDDLPGLQEMHRRCSAESVFRRYFTAFPRVSRHWQEQLLATEVCLVAVDAERDRVVGIANAARLEGSTAEIAVLVEDAWQSARVGSALIGHTAAAARLLGYRDLAGLVLPGADAVTAMAARLGPVAVLPAGGGAQILRIALGPRVLSALSDPDGLPRAG